MAVKLTAEWEANTPAFYNITYMQEMTSAVCSSVQTPSTSATISVTKSTYSTYGKSTSYVPETTLTDSRDSQHYVVRKLADGKCWTVQDYRYRAIIKNGIYYITSDIRNQVVPSNFHVPSSSDVSTLDSLYSDSQILNFPVQLTPYVGWYRKTTDTAYNPEYSFYHIITANKQTDGCFRMTSATGQLALYGDAQCSLPSAYPDGGALRIVAN